MRRNHAFLEAHELAFAYFGGVFRLLRYDNLTSAVKKILRGYQREETARFVAFRSHWGYESQFCNAAKGNEKGGVEGDVGYSRRNYLMPIPQVRHLVELNAHLLARSREDVGRKIGDRAQSVGTGMVIETEPCCHWRRESFELAEVSFLVVDGKGCVKARTNWYSTPLRAGAKARVNVLRRYGTKDDASLETSETTAEGARSSTWSITWKCWSASQARWRDQRHCNNGVRRDGGRTVMTGSGRV
jgi:hypothetical protein